MKEKEVEQITFSKEQILESSKYVKRRDALNVILENGKSYTLKEVADLLDKFMKGKVTN